MNANLPPRTNQPAAQLTDRYRVKISRSLKSVRGVLYQVEILSVYGGNPSHCGTFSGYGGLRELLLSVEGRPFFGIEYVGQKDNSIGKKEKTTIDGYFTKFCLENI